MQKTVFFAFRDDPVCFIHVLLNSLDMASQGMEGKIILEGKSVTLVSAMAKPDHLLHRLYTEVKQQGLLLGACRSCSAKLGAATAVEAEGIPFIGGMSGHPAMSPYIAQGYSVITF